jgi:predicted DNA-binding protein (UPF0251 family)
MGFNARQLDDAYNAYQQDPNTASDFFKLCLAVAHQQTSISAWNESKLGREDIAQEATIAAFTAIPTIKKDIVKTNDALRKLYAATENALLAKPPNDDPKQDSEWTRIGQAAGENLPLVKLLRQGLTVEEAAAELGITKEAAQQRMHRIRTKAQAVIQ